MSFLFGSNAPGVQTTTGEQYLQNPSQQVAGGLSQLVAQPYQPYQGPRIAELNPDQLAAMQQTRDIGGISNLGMNEAMGMTREAAGAVQPGEIQQYINPYMQDVAGNVAREMERRAAIQNQGMRTSATMAGAWGGARHGIQEAESERNLQRSLMDMYSAQYGQAWQFGLGTAERARDRQMGGGAQLAGQVGQRQATGYRDISALGAVGDIGQQQVQSNYDLAYGDFQRQQAYPQDQLSYMANTIRTLRGDPSSTTTKTEQKTGAFNQLAGGAIAALGAYFG